MLHRTVNFNAKNISEMHQQIKEKQRSLELRIAKDSPKPESDLGMKVPNNTPNVTPPPEIIKMDFTMI